MKYIECTHISGVECEYIAKGDYDEEVVETLVSHMHRHHNHFGEGLTERQIIILKKNIKDKIKEY